jgi:hypothetical protein
MKSTIELWGFLQGQLGEATLNMYISSLTIYNYGGIIICVWGALMKTIANDLLHVKYDYTSLGTRIHARCWQVQFILHTCML